MDEDWINKETIFSSSPYLENICVSNQVSKNDKKNDNKDIIVQPV
jgi:hypothetical protein